jgi:4-diphosphocytidyl-2C-methyl-D-erythritol kinase
MMEIREKAPAKINFGLDTLFRREDGYHELKMVMVSVDLSDYLTITSIPEKEIILTTNSAFLPCDRRNNVYQAAQKLMSRFDIQTGVKIHIEKNIPVSAGLGGGSSDCAAALRALNKLWNLGLTLDELALIGLEVGTDVPYCVFGNTSFITGVGEILEPLKDMMSCYVVIVKPAVSISTPTVFRSLDVEKVFHPNVDALAKGLDEQDYQKIIENMGNSLEEVTIQRVPKIARIKESMLKFGADVAMMSGSGPSVFCLVRQEKRAIRIYNALKGFNDEVYLSRILKGNVDI